MDVNQNEIETINENKNENAKKLILELIRKEEEEEEEEKKNDRIEFFQEAFNVMVFSFNREFMGLDSVTCRPINKVPFHRKIVTLPDFCYATFRM